VKNKDFRFSAAFRIPFCSLDKFNESTSAIRVRGIDDEGACYSKGKLRAEGGMSWDKRTACGWGRGVFGSPVFGWKAKVEILTGTASGTGRFTLRPKPTESLSTEVVEKELMVGVWLG